MNPQSGERLGRYQVLCPIASGGMATVYAARVIGEGAFQKPVALKLMLGHLARDEKFVAMFMDEAALAANIQSPHVVATYDLGREGDDTLYMALELVLGRTLRELGDAADGKPGAMPLDVALTILVQAARGLEDAHRAKSALGEPLDLVHRDVSPHNVLVGLDGRARISDFGIARAVARTSQTETGELKGKLAYFSPEQLRGQALDQRSDVFALGIVAWETLAGRRLFEADNPLALADRIANAPIPHLDTVRRDLPKGVAAAISAALVRDPDKRLSSAGALADRLTAAMAAAGVGQASPARVGELVRTLGGEKLSALEQRIATVLREVPLPSGSGSTGAHAAVTAAAARSAALAAPAAATQPSLSPPSVPPPGPMTTATGTGTGMVIVRRGPPPLVLALAAVLLVGGGGGAVFAVMRGGASTATSDTARRSDGASGESPNPTATALPSGPQHDAPAPAAIEGATGGASVHIDRASDEGADAGVSSASAAAATAVATGDAANGPRDARSDDATRGRRPAQRGPDDSAPRDAPRVGEAAQPVVPVAPPIAPVAPTPRTGGLVGVDEFDVDDGAR